MPEVLRSNAVSWPTDDQPLRGCVKCDYGRDLATEPAHVGLMCRNPDVAGRRVWVDAGAARRHGGVCGPNAAFLTIKGVLL